MRVWVRMCVCRSFTYSFGGSGDNVSLRPILAAAVAANSAAEETKEHNQQTTAPLGTGGAGAAAGSGAGNWREKYVIRASGWQVREGGRLRQAGREENL